ncbi:putative heme-binding domain-containing protein [Chitinophaga terrae (ex Kim and Jung 2007)]|uniref:c-type cytochrome n=1 Tax=Chitinophaga terrae (ex Kim and Jung 2007) TaxID=408074 RepID=UPI002784989E|nr:c-type cytochrome [Chitinophaga terrae (ex Kim and Jung 2007)]MDQ0106278.1 putative heme-binding domain-containing protein [Chitinophaga terrae (ex Kim and Jung 2007)]
MTALRKKSVQLLCVSAAFVAAIACINANSSTEQQQEQHLTGNPKIDKLKLPDNFKAERLYSPGDNKQGSWVSMTFDDKGRMIVSDQYGYLYRLQLPAVGEDSSKLKIEQLNIGKTADSQRVSMGYAHGLLYAFNSLYVMVNHNSDQRFEKTSGLYRLQDTDGDDQFDKITLIKTLEGEGEHGPHSIILSPDKKSLYVVCGNFTKIPQMNGYKVPFTAELDNLFPFLKDPNGHDNTVGKHGGWVAHMDSTGANWELISSGYRNPFDIAFNDAGDLFTYDSDMEWDFGTPWYRPTRICQVTSGSEYGWRPGTEKWSPAYPDNLPPLINIGQGSPTNLISASNARFPEKYRKGLLAFDWSFGIIYAIGLQPDGASYKATAEEFLSGSPLPLTDGAIGPDGALYFLTGGRRLESDLYRIYYKDNKESNAPLKVAAITPEAKIRRQLETYHGGPKAGAVDYAWQYLKHPDRFIRFAARVAIENQPTSEWQAKLLQEKDPVILTQGAIALARQSKTNVSAQILPQLMTINYDQLNADQQMDLLRAFELVIARMGKPSGQLYNQVVAYLDAHYPAKDNEHNKSLSKILVYLDAPKATEKTMALLATAKDDTTLQKTAMQSADLIMRNPQYGLDIAGMLSKTPPLQQTWYATVLSQAKTGWTPELHEQYFKWFYTAFTYKGGHSFIGFINNARKNALANAPKQEFAYYNKLSGDSLANLGGMQMEGYAQPKGPGRNWKVDEAVKVVETGLANRNFEQGKAMFHTALCSACHGMRGEGGTAGPDLTQLGSRFSDKDILESIIDPSKTISDQYSATVFALKKGGSVVGRMVSQDAEKYVVSQNPFAPQQQRTILKKDVASVKTSNVSVMLPGLINRLNEEELKDLMAYLKSGGNPKDSVFLSGTQITKNK